MRIALAFLIGAALAIGGTATAQTVDPVAALTARVLGLEQSDAEQNARLVALEKYDKNLAAYRFAESEMVFCLQEAMRQLRPISRTNRHVVAAPSWTRCYEDWR